MRGMAQHASAGHAYGMTSRGPDHQRKALRKLLLKDALMRTALAAYIACNQYFLFYFKNDVSQHGYEIWEFEPSPNHAFQMFLMLNDLRISRQGEILSRLETSTKQLWMCTA